MDRRRQIIFSLFDNRGFGLEIGPNCNPLLPKANYNVETLDHMSADELRVKYGSDANVDVSKIEDVDYVASGSIFEAVGQEARYDFIVASHVLEHATHLGFLADCERLLKPSGRLVLAIPDRRRCFDRFRPSSTTGQVLEARGRLNSCPGDVFDHAAYITEERRSRIHPGISRRLPSAFRRFYFTRTVKQAFAEYERVKKQPRFVDIHAWQFTPSSFRLIVADLAELGLISLREERFVDTVGHEFFISLSRTGRCPVDRLYLARGI